jgi:WD40 repeat protein
LKGHQGKNVRAIATFGDLLATGGEDGAIKVYDVKTLERS